MVSKKNQELILTEANPKILLIHSSRQKRYRADIDKIVNQTPDYKDFLSDYHNISDKFKIWFRVIRFVETPKNILSLYTVASSGALLSEVSKHSMSPYFYNRL